jgi:hypothetical protein
MMERASNCEGDNNRRTSRQHCSVGLSFRLIVVHGKDERAPNPVLEKTVGAAKDAVRSARSSTCRDGCCPCIQRRCRSLGPNRGRRVVTARAKHSRSGAALPTGLVSAATP